ncbi:MAG: sulfatase-like hydrolase/transferase [Clostridia bacterium]|nr:sulfatase-like hydrolase/transferase [Clostridia bacterium]
MKRILLKIKNILSIINSKCIKYYIYQILICILVLCTLFVNIESFVSYKDCRNYVDSDVCTLAFAQSSSYNFSFEAKDSTLDNFKLYYNKKSSHLSSSDKLNVLIHDDVGNEVFSGQAYLYNKSRDYVEVKCKGLDLDEDERYYVKLSFSDCAPDTIIVFDAHTTGGFDSSRNYVLNADTEDDMSFDLAVGFSKMLNINYSYSKINLKYVILNFVVYILSLSLLFIFSLWKKDSFKEFYRCVFGSLYLLIIGDILNVENASPLNFIFPFTLKHYFCFILMFIIIVLLYYAVYMLIGRGSLSFFIVSLPFIVLAYVNSVKLVMRGDSFMPWDLLSAGIAVKTGSTYYFHITKAFVSGIMLTVAWALILLITKTPRQKLNKQRSTCFALCSVLVALFVFSGILNKSLLKKLNIYYEVYPPIQSYNENGTYFAFLLHLNNINSRGSEVDSYANMLSIEDKYSLEIAKRRLDLNVFGNNIRCTDSTGKLVKPNVICIMSEAYADLSDIREFKTDIPVTPFMDSFEDETIHGDLAVSIFGGGTCNTEFEFLTGYSMSSLLPGSSVYTFYVNDYTENALPNIYAENGYRTVALHSFDGDWWDRREKYPLLGFEEFYTRDDFDPMTTHYVRNYISDLSTFEKITDIYDESVSMGEPLFLFCVTMQNHADFSQHFDNMKYDVHITDMKDDEGNDFVYAQNYLSLQKESDEALEYLINHIKESDYPTIVCFFGDHMPTLSDGFYDKLLENDMGTISLEDSLPLYNTDYFIWANYDLYNNRNFESSSLITSPNFLGQTVLDMSGILSPCSRSVLRILKEDICAVSAVAVYDKHGIPYTDVSMLPKNVSNSLNDYSAVEYGQIYYNDDVNEEN